MITCMRKPLAVKSAGRENRKRGFTLTEIAIVLGIIGLILGAIWVAAAAVYTNLRTSKTSTELLDILQNVRSMYATAGVVDATANMTLANPPTAQSGGGLTYVQAGVFPADMIDSTGTIVQNPWNGGAVVTAATTSVTNDSVTITMDGVPTGACINLVMSNSGTGRDPDLQQILTGPVGTVPTSVMAGGFPATASNAQLACANGGGKAAIAKVALGFTFKLK
jgi:prepilin-type N-terminal cleavage/methylation domain-containing protein